MSYFVYVIRSEKSGNLYKGMTADTAKRLLSHNRGKVRSTKGHVPWQVVYLEEYQTEGEARARELFLKSGRGRAFLKAKGIA